MKSEDEDVVGSRSEGEKDRGGEEGEGGLRGNQENFYNIIRLLAACQRTVL